MSYASKKRRAKAMSYQEEIDRRVAEAFFAGEEPSVRMRSSKLAMLFTLALSRFLRLKKIGVETNGRFFWPLRDYQSLALKAGMELIAPWQESATSNVLRVSYGDRNLGLTNHFKVAQAALFLLDHVKQSSNPNRTFVELIQRIELAEKELLSELRRACICGHSGRWKDFALVGTQTVEYGASLELRNCPGCGSTVCRELPA